MKEKDHSFGNYLRNELHNRKLSMRRFAEMCGVDPATVSRLASGKQRPRAEHLLMIARVLQVSPQELWTIAGYALGEEMSTKDFAKNESSQVVHHDVFHQDHLLKTYELPTLQATDIEQIMVELRKCKDYAGTKEGKELILRDFLQKINQLQGIGPFIEQLHAMYELFQDEELTAEQRQVLGSALLYFISATDIIPDYSFPLGYLDDAVAIDLVWKEMKTWKKQEGEC